MCLLNVMTAKGLLSRTSRGRAFVYEPPETREPTLRSMLRETLSRVYGGSARLLIAHLLDQSNPTIAELDEIRRLLDAYEEQKAGAGAAPGEDGNGNGG
jgi:predicted transcriptional regulator